MRLLRSNLWQLHTVHTSAAAWRWIALSAPQLATKLDPVAADLLLTTPTPAQQDSIQPSVAASETSQQNADAQCSITADVSKSSTDALGSIFKNDRASTDTLYRSLFRGNNVSTPELEYATSIFNQPAKFVQAYRTWRDIVCDFRTEIALVGRTNVGKSSMLNALLRGDTAKRNQARPSSQPGFTKTLNLFHVGGKLAVFDLPGYGHKSTETQMHTLGSFITNRPQLHAVCVLVDATAGIKDIDRFLMALLDDHNKPYQIILTKSDKLGLKELQQALRDTQEYINTSTKYCLKIVQPVSSKTSYGMAHLKHWLLITSGFRLPRD